MGAFLDNKHEVEAAKGLMCAADLAIVERAALEAMQAQGPHRDERGCERPWSASETQAAGR